jgi:hypothetical protein
MAAQKKPVKPEPITKHIVCSLCGLNWEQHGENPGAEKCIELLKAELARRVNPLILQSGSTYGQQAAVWQQQQHRKMQ